MPHHKRRHGAERRHRGQLVLAAPVDPRQILLREILGEEFVAETAVDRVAARREDVAVLATEEERRGAQDAFRELRGRLRHPDAARAVDADRDDLVVQRFGPFRGQAGCAGNDAHRRPERRARAVGVLAAGVGQADGLPEIALAIEPPGDRVGAILGRVETRFAGEEFRIGLVDLRELLVLDPEGARRGVVDALPRLGERHAVVVAAYRLSDGLRQKRSVGNVGEPDLDQLAVVALHERRALQRREEDLAVRPFARVVDDRVLERVARGDLGMPRRQARPDLGADEAAAGVPVDVVEMARDRRQQSGAHVGLARPVLNPVGDHEAQPVLAEDRRVHLASELFDGGQPDDLQVEIVVRRRPFRQVLRVELHVVQLPFAFERRAQHAADVLAGPAASHLVPISREIKRLHFFFLFLGEFLVFSDIKSNAFDDASRLKGNRQNAGPFDKPGFQLAAFDRQEPGRVQHRDQPLGRLEPHGFVRLADGRQRRIGDLE